MKTAFKIVLLLIISALSNNLYAQCDYTDDFVATGATSSNTDGTLTSANGWTWLRIIHTANSEEIQINGSKTPPPGYQGYIASPTFNNGCKAIKFSCKTISGIKLKLDIKQDDISVWNEEVVLDADDEWHEISKDVDIEGDFQFVITNTSGKAVGTGQGLISVKDICITTNTAPAVIPAHNFQFNVSKDATVYVGDKDQTVTVAGNYLTKHYVPFTEKPAAAVIETDTSKIWYYDLPAPKNSSGGFNYRVTRTGKAPHVGLFKPKAGTTVESDTLLVFTDAELSAHNAKDIDHDVNSLDGRNVADMLININAQGYLTLPLRADTTFQLIHTRNWQAIDTDVNNYFIEPDFHYTVVDETGQPSNSVITVSDSGVIKPVGAGTAIVLVDYDAMLCHHTANLRITDVKTNPAFFSASWGENTAVFVVSVAQPEAGITTNMNLNAYWAQDGTDKTEGVAIDAEHDVLYFEADKGSFPYTFKPEGATQVLAATPVVSATATAYNGFRTDSVTANSDGSYTVKLGFGRNIVKLVSATGATYQVITAKPVTYTVSNDTHPNEPFRAGDEVSVVFNTLYHPANKMSGIYNMTAGIQYTGDAVNFPLILGPGQYTFASRAQEYKVTIPADYAEDEFTLTNGVIKVKGFGSYYGAHRKITIQNGVNPNLNASVREAYFGALPDITIRMKSGQSGIKNISDNRIIIYPNPFVDYIVIDAVENGTIAIYDMSGKVVLSTEVKVGNNRINTSALPKGVYVLKQGLNVVKIVK